MKLAVFIVILASYACWSRSDVQFGDAAEPSWRARALLFRYGIGQNLGAEASGSTYESGGRRADAALQKQYQFMFESVKENDNTIKSHEQTMEMAYGPEIVYKLGSLLGDIEFQRSTMAEIQSSAKRNRQWKSQEMDKAHNLMVKISAEIAIVLAAHNAPLDEVMVFKQSAEAGTTLAPRASPLASAQQNIVRDMSWPTKIMYYKHQLNASDQEQRENLLKISASTEENSGRIVMRSQQDGVDMSTDETQMKLKLFTLMDEAVRECDLKVRRADMIRGYYKNNTAFGVGFLMGSISDKFRQMTDTTKMLKKLYDEWKPIDHINAYEQIANQAIEMTQLIDTAKVEMEKLDGHREDKKVDVVDTIIGNVTNPERKSGRRG